jgi:hypothetical protein
MPPPPKPDGGFVIPAPGGDGSSAQDSLWDLGGLQTTDPKTGQPSLIMTGLPTRPRGASRQLDPYDRENQQSQFNAEAAPVLRTPLELVQYPIKLYASNPAEYLQLQQALFAAGFYGSTPASSIPWGSDPQGTTYDAWKKVVIASQQAQQAGYNITPTDLLNDAVARHKAAQKGIAVPKAPLIIQQTDPAVLRGVAQTAAQAALGRNLSASEVNSFVEEYHKQEAAISKQNYEAQQDQTGGTHTITNLTEGSAQAMAEEEVKKNHPVEYQGQQLAGYIGVLQQLINGG